jgi:Tol biopolymer transport system component
VAWTFTTGAPQATLSNQVVFLSDRGGIANVWAMNPDGTGQHQVSAELAPVVDYAAAPDGSSIVIGDGRRLVHLRADGSGRRVLTDAAHLEFDATYSPDGSRVAFARADASTGRGLGLWEWDVGGGAATEVELPEGPDGGTATPSTPDEDGPLPLRAPRYSSDGGLMAFVDLTGSVGMLAAEEGEITVVEVTAAGTPAWDPGSGALLVPLGSTPASGPFEAPVMPFAPTEPVEIGLARPGRDGIDDAGLGLVTSLATAADGRVGWIDEGGHAHVADGLEDGGATPDGLEDLAVTEIAFSPVEDVVLVVSGGEQAGGRRIDRVDLASGERTALTRNGWKVRWLP